MSSKAETAAKTNEINIKVKDQVRNLFLNTFILESQCSSFQN